MTKKIVAHVCVTPGLGGLELYSMQLHQMFKKEGFPSLHFCQENSPFEKKLGEEGLDFVSLPKTSYFSPATIMRVRKELKDRKIQHIYIHHLKDLWFLVPAMIGMPEIKLVGFAQMFIKNINKKDFLHTKLYNRMKLLITLTDIQQAELKKCLGLDKDRYITIPNSVDMNKFKDLSVSRQTIRKQMGYEDNELVVGVLGRLDPWKGQKELLEAFVDISKSNKTLRLLVIGSETPGEEGYRQDLLETVEKHNISTQVNFIDFQSNVNEWLSAMDIFVMPSYEEAFGIVLIEAMAAGLPVISTNAGGVPDIILDSSVGLLVEARSGKALAPALEKLVGSKELRTKMGKAAKVYAHTKYDLNIIYKQVKATQDMG